MNMTSATMNLFFYGLLLTFLFIILSFKELWYMMGSFIRAPKKEMRQTLLGICLDLVVFALILFTFLYQEQVSVPDGCRILGSIPVPIWYIYAFFSCIYTMHVRRDLVKWRRTHVTIKTHHQALDNLPIGICVYNSQGVLQMANYQMQNLCRRYTDSPLLNGLLWEKAISALPDMMLSFSSEEIWHFRRFPKENNLTILTATNVSEEMALNRELQIENRQLEEINRRMRQYGLDLEDIIKQEELLNTQIRVHDELGHILLTSRVFMNGADFAVSEKQLQSEWKQLLVSMKEFRDTSEDDSQISDLIKAAKMLGINIVMDGKLPANQTMRHLLAATARECLTNAAKVGASNLRISITNPSEDRPSTRIDFTNDGLLPTGPVYEGVGLGTLRQIVEREGASMTITADSTFCLTIER